MQSLSATSASGVLLDLCAVVILLCAFACLGSKLFDRYVIYYATQSAVLAIATGTVAYHVGKVDLWLLAVLTLLIKGIAIPAGAHRFLLERLRLKRDVALAIGPTSSLIIGALLTAFAYLVSRPFLLPSALVDAAVVPLANAVILLGALSMVVRRHPVGQFIGWLILENGLFLGAITLVATFPFIVEAGVFLDLVGAVLIMLALVSGLVERVAGATAHELKELRG